MQQLEIERLNNLISKDQCNYQQSKIDQFKEKCFKKYLNLDKSNHEVIIENTPLFSNDSVSC